MAKNPPFLYGRKKCIFCEEFGVTKEHVFGDWLREIFPRDAETTHTFGVVTWPDVLAAPDRPTVALTKGQGHSGSKKVRVVCGNCNTGWLSTNVEDRAKPVLVPLIAGREGVLNESMQRAVATWAAKTAMTSEFIKRREAAIQQHERAWLKNHQEPPHGWYIWAAPYSGSEWRDLGIFQHTGKLEIPPVNNGTPAQHNLALTFLGLGHLFLLIRHSTWDRLWPVLSKDIPHVHRIWPISDDINWPPPYVLTDVEAEYFTTYLARVLNERV